MENPAPFDLNEAIRQWQKNLGASPAFSADNLEEMASHLRASVQKLKATGLSDKDAFETAVQRLGEREPLEREFAKVNPPVAWSLPVVSFWIVAGLYLLQVGQSLVIGMLAWRELLDGRAYQHFLAAGPSGRQITNYYLQWHSRLYPRPFVPIMSIVVVLVSGLGVRLATGNWKSIGAFLTSCERPILHFAVVGWSWTSPNCLARLFARDVECSSFRSWENLGASGRSGWQSRRQRHYRRNHGFALPACVAQNVCGWRRASQSHN